MWTRVHIFNFCEKNIFDQKIGFFPIFGKNWAFLKGNHDFALKMTKNRKKIRFFGQFIFSQKLKI